MTRQLPLDEIQPRRLCLIKPSALGDVIQALPVLSGLRNRWPETHISWVVNQSFAGLLAGHPELDEVIPFQRRGRVVQRAKAMWQLLRRLRQGRFDLVVDLQGLLRSAVMTTATGAARRVGFSHAREGATLAYTDRIAVDWRNTSAVLCNWNIARAFGCPDEPSVPRLGITDEQRAWVEEQVEALPRPLLIVHPGAQWQTKRWPPEYFADLARRAQDEFSAGVVLVGGPGEGELCKAIMARLRPETARNLAERTPLLQLAALLARGDVYLSGDSGPMHLAAAVGTTVVAIFTCTSPMRAGPYGIGHRVVATQVPCAASYLKTCRSMICMQEVTPLRVWPVLKEVLSFTDSRSGAA